MNFLGCALFSALFLMQPKIYPGAALDSEKQLDILKQNLKANSCNLKDRIQLDELLKIFAADPKYANDLRIAAETLLECDPNNPDYLFFLGRAEYLLGHLEIAKGLLIKTLKIAPRYSDAEILLASIYLKEGEDELALAIYEKYPKDPEALEKIGDINLTNRNFAKAIEVFYELYIQNPENPSYVKKYAYALEQNRQYKKSADVLNRYLETQQNTDLKFQLYEVKTFVDPALIYSGSYLESKENDPFIGQAVVRNYYYDQGLFIETPILDNLFVGSKLIDYRQQETDIYPPVGINYNVQIYGAQEKIKYLIGAVCDLNVVLRGFYAYGKGHEFYPFHDCWRFEPGLTFVYKPSNQFLFADAHVESFIIKNFTTITSELMRTDYLDIGYGYQSPTKISPEVEGYLSTIFYHDDLDNIKNVQSVLFRLKIPSKSSWIKGLYRFDHSSFKYLNINYYSYKNQWISTLGFLAHARVAKHAFLDLAYEHAWQVTNNLYQPIGDFIYIKNRQSLICNKFSALYQLHLHEAWKVDLYGHYFYNNQPYRDFQIKGAVKVQF